MRKLGWAKNKGSKNPEHSKRMKGRKWSEETIRKRKGTFKGHHYNLGCKQSEKTKKAKSINWSGAKNPNWKGGITDENKKIRNGIEIRLWRGAVFARDNWACQKCNIRGGKLHSHHINNFAQYPELRVALDNGITFCRICHKKFHKEYGIKNNNREQIINFL